jgi:exodeoxyribonuclease X
MKIVILDTETTGIKEEDRICQLSFIIANQELEIEEIYNELVKPPVPISYEAMAIHHITNEAIQNALPIEKTKAYQRLIELNKIENILVIHNAEFDIKMLQKEGFTPHFRIIDTFRVLKHILPDGKFSLQYNRYALGLYKKESEIANKYNITINPHDALSDVIVLYLLLVYLKEQYSFEELIELTKKPILQEKFYMGKYKFQKIKDVIIKHPDYIENLLHAKDTPEDIIYSINHYLKELDEPMQFRFNVGKYKGMLVEDVAEIDKEYLKWAYHNMKMGKWMRERIKELLSL